MHAQIITYKIKDITEADYVARMVEPDAPLLAKVPGLHSKVWLADREANTYGGFYLWQTRADMEAFMASDLVAAMAARPFITDVTFSNYEVQDAPSRITRGLAMA